MILTIFSFNEDKDLKELQNLFLDFYKNRMSINCNFTDEYCNHTQNEIAVLFIDDYIEIFYASPRFDFFDKIIHVSYSDYVSLLKKINNFCENNFSAASHIFYTEKSVPFKKVINFFPDEYLNEKNYSKSISALSENLTCSVSICPNEQKDKIMINFETYNSKISTISTIKDTKFINDFFSFNSEFSIFDNFLLLLTHLSNHERNEMLNG